MAVTIMAATGSAVTLGIGDVRINRIELVAGPTVDATLSLAGTVTYPMAAKAGTMESLELKGGNKLQKTLATLTVTGTGAKAIVNWEQV
jgi:hypothetical protein